MAASELRVGFIGLGSMGFPMASRLHAAGYAITVSDANPANTVRFVSSHYGALAANESDVFASCPAVILMLPDSDAVDAVVRGQDGQPGLASVLREGSTLVDMGSSQPLRTQALGETLDGLGIRFLDAPVSGGVKRAAQGSLAIMAGGEANVIDRVRPLLGHLGTTVTHVGPVGAGHAVKALNNYVSAAGLLATVEALHLGQHFGLDPTVITDVLNSSTGKNNTTEHKVKPFMLNGAFNSGFSLALMAKDLGIAMALGRDTGRPLQLGEEVLQMWRKASVDLGPTADHTEMFRWLTAHRAS